MAAALASGKTRIINAAKEPEVVQLCQALQDGGLSIQGVGTSEIISIIYDSVSSSLRSDIST